jgi:hypothetical protein
MKNLHLLIIVISGIVMLSNTNFIFAATNVSPLKQFQSGISAEDVKCGPGFQLIVKAHDGYPACVKPQTAMKLVERGWGRIVTLSSCPGNQTMANGHCNSVSATAQACSGDTLIPYSYSSPCIQPTPTCPKEMSYSNGVCTTTPPYVPPQPKPVQCDPNTGVCSSQGYAIVSCGGEFSGNICEPNSIPCPTGLQGDNFGSTCNYSPPKCST